MIKVLSTLFVQAGVMPTVNNIEQICRCPGEQLNAPNLCLKGKCGRNKRKRLDGVK